MDRWRAALAWALWGLVLASALAQAGSLAWFLDLLTHFRLHYALGGALLAPCLLLVRRPVLAGVALAVGLANGLALGLGAAPAKPAPFGPGLRVAVANVHQPNRDYSTGAALRDAYAPDLLGFVEVDPRWVRALDRTLPGYRYRLEAPRNDSFGVALYSRLRLEEGAVRSLGPDRHPAVIARLKVGGRPVRVVLFHAQAPLARSETRARNAELAGLAALHAAFDEPLVVLGDLNVTPWSPAFRQLLQVGQLRDSRRGHGIQGSWPSWAPGLRIPIDHVLVSAEWRVTRRTLGAPHGSDHLPVVAELGLTGMQGSHVASGS